MQKTLMTPNDVITYSNLKRVGFSPCTFSQLHQIEYAEARTCLGFELWTNMIAAKADYSQVERYVNKDYDAEELVSYNGVVYQAKVATSQMPTVITDWSLAPIFAEGDCQEVYDDLFCLFIAPYLAHRVLHRRLPFIRNIIKDNGVLEYSGDQYETTDEGQFKSLQHAINRDAAEAWNNLVHYMSQDAQKALSETCLKGWLAYETEKECGPGGQDCGTGKHLRTGKWKFA